MVTAAFGRTLGEALAGTPAGGVESAGVTTLRPDSLAADADARGVNVFLYQVSPNAAWANNALPTRNGAGALLTRPQQALDLRYVLTFSGDEATLEPQRLLGLVVATLASRPILGRDLVRDIIARVVDEDPTAWEQFSDLPDQVDVVRLGLVPLTLDELSNLWSTFFQTPYRLSIVYQATVVLVDGDGTPAAPLPVRSRGVGTVGGRLPTVTRAGAAEGPAGPLVPGATLQVDGLRLRGPAATVVRVADVEVEVAPGETTDARLRLPLPDGVAAGVRGVQVLHPPLGGAKSRAVPVVVRPAITGPVTATAGDVDDPPTVTLPVAPPVGRDQRVVLLLNERRPPADRPPRAYAFVAPGRDPDGPATDTALTVPVPGVEAGGYVVRVQVDGADSVLAVDAEGRYDTPRVTVP
jgi:hypothetical protein